MNKLVSIVIPTYGRPAYLKRAIDSCLNQTYNNIEIIVVDDNDPDTIERVETEKLIGHYIKKYNLIYLKHKQNINGSAARNSGLKIASGDYISFLDDDDELIEDKIELQIKAFKQNPIYGAIYCLNVHLYNGKELFKTDYKINGNCALDILQLKSEIHTSSLLLKTDKVKEINGFDESFRRHQEYEFMIRFFEHNIMYCVPSILLNVHVDSTMNRPKIDKMVDAKNHFFSKMQPYIDKYTAEEQKNIYKVHNLQLFRIGLKSYNFSSVKYFFKANPNYNDIKIFIFSYVKKYIKIFSIKISRNKN